MLWLVFLFFKALISFDVSFRLYFVDTCSFGSSLLATGATSITCTSLFTFRCSDIWGIHGVFSGLLSSYIENQITDDPDLCQRSSLNATRMKSPLSPVYGQTIGWKKVPLFSLSKRAIRSSDFSLIICAQMQQSHFLLSFWVLLLLDTFQSWQNRSKQWLLK